MHKKSWFSPQFSNPYSIALGLVILSLLLVTARNVFLSSGLPQSQYNHLEMTFTLSDAVVGQTEVRLPMPISTAKHRILSQQMNYAGWRIRHRNYKEVAERGIKFSLIEQVNPSRIQLGYLIERQNVNSVRFAKPISTELVKKYLAISPTQLPMYNLQPLPDNRVSQELAVLKSWLADNKRLWWRQAHQQDLGVYGCEQDRKIQTPLLLQLRYWQIPSRLVCGLWADAEQVQRRSLIEVYLNNQWHWLELKGLNTDNFIAFYRGDGGFFKVYGPGKVTFKARLTPASNKLLDGMDAPFTSQPINWHKLFDLRQLPIEAQQLLEVILILPLAVLLIALLRLYWQVPLLGTLTPALLGMALAFNHIGLSLLLMVLVLGPLFWIRHHSHSKAKVITHGLSLTFITLLLLILITVFDALQWLESPSDLLLPTVLLVLLVDKYYQSYQKQGAFMAHRQLLYTIGFALLVIPIMQLGQLGGWLLRYPELHLLTLALLVVLWHQVKKQSEQAD